MPKEIKTEIKGEPRQVKLEDMWLLYNYETFLSYHWTRKSAIKEARYMDSGQYNGEKISDLPEHYQILRGDIIINIH
jgi:hypothetical protein